jgi:hypothetical protein
MNKGESLKMFCVMGIVMGIDFLGNIKGLTA